MMLFVAMASYLTENSTVITVHVRKAIVDEACLKVIVKRPIKISRLQCVLCLVLSY